MANTSFSPMDFNQDGNVSNLELAAAVNEVNELSGKKKHPLAGRILLAVTILVLGLVFIAVGWLLFQYKMTDVAIIGIVITMIPIIYLVSVLIRWHKLKKKGLI